MNGTTAAFCATGLYYLGFAVFKLAADRMAPLRGNRIPHMVWTIVRDWVFLVALAFVLGGLGLQILALGRLPLSTAVPVFMSGVVPLLLIALVFFGERLTPREWLSLVLIGGAILLLTASLGADEPIRSAGAPLWKVAVVAAPAVLVPVVILVIGDHRPDGRHARPITGIAYGLSAGFPVGAAELAVKGWSDRADTAEPGIATTPWPYLTVLAAAIGFGIMVMAFQRCRVSIVATVMTVTAKTYLLTMGTFMYGETWPRDSVYSAMRLGALALGVIAVLRFPRHRPVREAPRESPEEDDAPARDPFGDPVPVGRPADALGVAERTERADQVDVAEDADGGAAPRVPPPRTPPGQDRGASGAHGLRGPRPPRRPVRPVSPTETGADGRWRGLGG